MTHAIANRSQLPIAISMSQAFPAEIAVKLQCCKVFSESQSCGNVFFELRLQSLAICDSKSLRFGGSLSQATPRRPQNYPFFGTSRRDGVERKIALGEVFKTFEFLQFPRI